MKLGPEFESDLEQALLEQAAEELTPPGGPVMTAIEASQDTLRESEYDTANIYEALWGPAVAIEGDRVEVTWGWAHPGARPLETGTTGHTVDGDPILSFIWRDAPQSVHEMFPDTQRENGDPRVFLPEVDVAGIDEVRFTRLGLRVLRNTLQD